MKYPLNHLVQNIIGLLFAKKKLIIYLLLIGVILITFGFIGLITLREISKFREYNSHIDKVRIAIENNNLDKANQELEESRKIVLNSPFLFRIKKTELWLLKEISQLYSQREDLLEKQNDKTAATNESQNDAQPSENYTQNNIPEIENSLPAQITSEGYTESNTYPIIRSYRQKRGGFGLAERV